MNILVTGSAGMIGGYVVKGLMDKGHTVIGVDRRTSEEKNPNFTQIILDLSSFDNSILNFLVRVGSEIFILLAISYR